MPNSRTPHDPIVTVYTKNDCQPCRLTKAYLDRENIPYQAFNIEEDDDARQKLMDLGIQQVPAVFTGFKHWSGLRPDLLAEIPR